MMAFESNRCSSESPELKTLDRSGRNITKDFLSFTGIDWKIDLFNSRILRYGDVKFRKNYEKKWYRLNEQQESRWFLNHYRKIASGNLNFTATHLSAK